MSLHALLGERRCLVCRAPFAPWADADIGSALRERLCPCCAPRVLARRAAWCAGCGLPFPAGLGPALCGRCLAEPPPWETFRCIGVYDDLVRDLLIRGKFGATYDAAALDVLGYCLAEACADLRPDVVLPMPLHPSRLRSRGFNQCQELARPVARRLGVPLEAQLLRRVVDTPSQRELSREGRLHGLVGAFAADTAVNNLRVLLLDDVLTTGTTARRATRCLRGAGAVVDLAVAARAVLK